MTARELLASALDRARDTRRLMVGRGALREVAALFGELFGDSSALVVADENTFRVAGQQVYDVLRTAGRACDEPLILPAARLHAESPWVTHIRSALSEADVIPVAVGAGTINDLTKLAAHQRDRRYLCVATAASMDGYTAFGASITHEGSKQTFDCPAPGGVVADLDVIAEAPPKLNAAGYADLLAKCPAGADWMIADELGVDPIDPAVWEMVQAHLRTWIDAPEGIPERRPDVLEKMITALMITGFAMQSSCSSRPASGAEHQFSHLWDMQHHTYQGQVPFHGFKVGIGSLVSLAVYEALLECDLKELDVDAAVTAWPSAADNEREIAELFTEPNLVHKARLESGAKHVERDALRVQLNLLKSSWPRLRDRLARQLLTHSEARDMLRAAGCPVECEQIGISSSRLRSSCRQAYDIRRRFTVLDVLRRTNFWDQVLDQVFTTSRQEMAS